MHHVIDYKYTIHLVIINDHILLLPACLRERDRQTDRQTDRQRARERGGRKSERERERERGEGENEREEGGRAGGGGGGRKTERRDARRKSLFDWPSQTLVMIAYCTLSKCSEELVNHVKLQSQMMMMMTVFI